MEFKINPIQALVTLIVVAILSAAATKYYFPTVQSKTVEVEKEVVRTDIKTITKTIKSPDGRIEIVQETIDKSVKKETSTKEVLIAKKNDWLIGGGALSQINDLSNRGWYGQVGYRVLGPAYLTGTVSVSKDTIASVGLLIEF